MRNIIWIALLFVLTCYSETLFEVKDASNNKVLDISTDGLRVMNQGDTLMVISSNEIKANLSNSKGLSRSFSVTTTSSVKGSETKSSGIDLMRLTGDSTRFWISDTGSGFGVSSLTAAKEKSVATDFLKVSNLNTEMREGTAGNRYTDFSPVNLFLGLNAGLNTVSQLDIYEQIYDGSYNVFIGNNAGLSNSSGWSNIFIGNEAGRNNSTSYRNTYIGEQSGYNSNGTSSTFVGFKSGYENTSGIGNSFYGDAAGLYNTTGSYNSYFGYTAGLNNTTGNYNTIIGHLAGRGITGATANSNNCLFGYYSGGLHRTGDNNVMIGNYSGYNNSSGGGNVFLGYNAGYNETGSNKLYIDNSSTTSPLIFGDFNYNRVVIKGNAADNPSNFTFYVNGTAGGDYAWNSLSDKRLKKNIVTIDSPINIVSNLRGVYYEWNDPDTHEKGRRIGFIAQETSKVLPEVVDESGEYFSMQYAPITALLVEAVKEQQKGIEALSKTNTELENEITELRRELSEIKKILNKK
ncbi:MAG: tail fiber domain-containing protein [Candidatus Delongbacteria bacterium]|jgi:hypothetical protein|nr:tail fiber domain-containing protein [Candidatus Delongbacteria bacterium]